MMKRLLICLLVMMMCLPCAGAEAHPVQVDLPLPDAAQYVPDPFLRTVTQLMTEYEHAARAGWSDRDGVEWTKTTTLVTLHLPTVRMDGDRATVFARVCSARYALWEDGQLRLMTSRLGPRRIDLERTGGAWKITSVIECQDGDLFWPSILEFCEQDELLASTLTLPVGAEEHDFALERYLIALGYRESPEED